MPDMTIKVPLPPWVVLLKRNPSYLNSLKVTAKRLVFYAPLDMWSFYKAHVLGLVAIVLVTSAALVIWPIIQLFLIAAGLLGFINDPEPETAPGRTTPENGAEPL